MTTRYAQFYVDDPEPEEDEVITPRTEWYSDLCCHACMKEAVAKVELPRGDTMQPAKFLLCGTHTENLLKHGADATWL